MYKHRFSVIGAFAAVLALAPVSSEAARGSVHIGSSKGALTVLTDRGTPLRGKDVWVKPGYLEGENCYADVRNLGLNTIHLRCEDDLVGGVRIWQLPEIKVYIDSAINWCDRYGLYAIICYSDGSPPNFNDGRTEFSEYMAQRYKDRTHVILEPSNEAYAGDPEIDLIKRIRVIAPEMHIIMFTFMCTPSFDDAEIVNARNKGIDFSNISVGYHLYCGGVPANLQAWKNAGLALIMLEFTDWPETITSQETAGISWILFFSDHTRGEHLPDCCPFCNFVNAFPTTMAKAIQNGGAANVCWLPDYGSVPGCNTPSGPYIQLSKSSISSLIAKGAGAPSDTITALGSNMGASTLADVTAAITYQSGNGWLSISRLGSGNRQQLVNTLSSASLPAGTYSATVTVSAVSVQQATYTVQLTVVEPRAPENPAAAAPGLAYSYYQGSWTSLPAFGSLTPVKSGVAPVVDLTAATAADNFALHFTGFIDVPTTGTYTFALSSDDGSRMYVGTQQLVDNGGTHAVKEASGSIILAAGKHAITIDYFEAAGEQTLAAFWQGPGIMRQAIPASVLFHSDATSAVSRGIATIAQRPMTIVRNSAGLRVTVGVDGAYTLEAFGWDGRRVSTFAGRGPGMVLLSKKQLPAGTYLLRLSGPAGTVAVDRVAR